MGSSWSSNDPFVLQAKQTWTKEHRLFKNTTAAAEYEILAREHFAVGTEVTMYRKSYAVFSTKELRRYFITSGNWIADWPDHVYSGREIGRAVFAIRECSRETILADECNFEVDTFKMSASQLEKLCLVVGATNYCIACRNSEHFARYIHNGAWVSDQMLSEGLLGKHLRPHMSEADSKKVNKHPKELEMTETEATPMFEGMPAYIEFSRYKTELTEEDADAFNIAVIGPTGSGKSSVINHLFNCRVSKQAASARSVTRRMTIISGVADIQTFDENSPRQRRRVNVIDTIGFCDSTMEPSTVVHIIQDWLRVQKTKLDKVIVVVYGRIEKDHADSIKRMLKWLNIRKYRQNFIFVYNKADQVDDEATLWENVAEMGETLGTPGVEAYFVVDAANGDRRLMHWNLPLGIPPKAPYEEAHAELQRLVLPLFCDVSTGRVDADVAKCTIL